MDEKRFKCAHDKLVETHKLIPNPKNPNNHPKAQIDALAYIIDHQGQRSPVVVSNRSGFITKGHGRLQAIKQLGWTHVAVDYQDYDSEAQEYADMIADNKIAELAEHDDNMMITDLKGFPDMDLNLLGMPGFEMPTEIEAPVGDPDEVPEVKESPVVRGEVYILGNHRLMCGDSTMIDDVEKLMNGSKADLVHTDPPYNVNYSNADRPKSGKVDLGHIKNDKMSDSDFYDFLHKAFLNCFLVSKEDSSIYIWYASKESVNFMKATEDSGWVINQQVIWKKPMLLGRGKYQWAHEPCIFAIKGKPWFTDDRTKTTVWDFGGYDKSKNVHPTQKPLFIPEEAINNSSKDGSNVLDVFGGSGSTLIACEKLSRKAFIMELDEKFVAVILDRWQKYTGKKAHREDGKLWDDIKAGI